MIEYPYLPEGRQILYVSADNPFMIEAKKVCLEQSTDDRQPSGAVIVRDGKIIGRGALRGMIPNQSFQKWHEDWCPRKLLKVKSGTKYWMCPGCAAPYFHSEPRAIRNAHKNGHATEGTDLYLWGHWWCCKPCWDRMIAAGVKNVYLLERSEVYFNRGNPNNRLGRKNFHLFT